VTVASHPFGDRLGYWIERVAAGEEVLDTHRRTPWVRLLPFEAYRRQSADKPDHADL
jgi:antitoxin (DNA-binding transcriptional repressor) of toxin-antitoxin stability system